MWNIDFLPERIKRQRARRIRLIRQGYLLAVCVVAFVVLGYVRQGRISAASAELGMVAERSVNVRQQLQMRSSLEHQMSELMLIKKINDTLGSRVVVVDVLAELNRLVPMSISLTRFEVETIKVHVPVQASGATNRSSRAVRATGGKIPVKVDKRLRLILTGVAPADVEVANFIGQLSASGLFEDVNMGYAKTVEFRKRNASEFQVGCYVVR